MVKPARHSAKLDEGIVACGELWVGGEAVCVCIFVFHSLSDLGDTIVEAFSEFYFFPLPFLCRFFLFPLEESLPRASAFWPRGALLFFRAEGE